MGSALVSNPPYNMSWKPPALAHFDKRFMGINVPPKSNANYAFILTGLQISDKSCFLLPTSVLNPSGDEKNILKTIVDSNLLKAVILLPDNMFESTAIATALLIFEHERMTRNIAMINLKDSYIEEVREQRGQFGGGAHENRVYKKTLKALSDETIEHVVEVIEQQKNVDGICRIVTFNEVREKDYDIRPILYLHSPKEEAIHRSFKDIATDHRKIVRKKNAVKITINETIAKTFGIYDMYKNKTKSLSESFSAVDEETEEEDFITFTKNAEFKITCRTNVDSIPEIILYFMGLWKQQMMILNNDENRVLAEFRDALQSELFSGRIKLDKNGETEEKR